MGVKGLWRLITSSGTPVPLESLENKILAIDVSIWLHQAIRGFKGFGIGSVANAHLLTLFHRICKLLFYRIKPVFVFDGGVPHLKRQTLASRRLRREVAAGKAQKVRERLLVNLLKSQAVRRALGKKGPAPAQNYVVKPVKKEKDLFELPPLPLENQLHVSSKKDSDDEEEYILKNMKAPNLHNFEFESNDFKSLALETQHEILSELQETRKESSWNIVNNMPQESDTFSSFQMGRLLKRRKFQETLDDVRTEIRQKHAADMEAQLFGDLEKHVSLTHRIISEDETHSILIKNIKDNSEHIAKLPLERQIQEIREKNLDSKVVRKEDFLTELAKHGIVRIDSKQNLRNEFFESDDDLSSESSDDESFMPLCKKRKLEEATFLKAMDYVLDENEFTQEELLTLIQQSKNEETGSQMNKDSKLSNVFLDFEKPSTSASASGFIDNKSETNSSLTDEDFIDVLDEDVSNSEFPISNINSEATFNTSTLKKVSDTSPIKGSNVDVIRNAQNNSLYLKIMQQKLDDIVVQNATKSKKNVGLVDSRKQNQNAIVELNSNQHLEPCSPMSSNSASPTKGVALSFDFISKAPTPKKDDLFSDIFCKPIDKTVQSAKLNNSIANVNYMGTVGKIGSTKLDHLLIENSNREADSNQSSGKEKLPISIPSFSNTQLTDQLKDKISELLELEVKKIISESSNVFHEDRAETTPSMQDNTGISRNTANVDMNLLSSRSNIEGLKSVIQNNDADLSEFNLEKNGLAPVGGNSKNSICQPNTNEKIISSESIPINTSNNMDVAYKHTTYNIHTPMNSSETVNLNNCTSIEKPLSYSDTELKEMVSQLDIEKDILVAEAHSQDRVATELSDQVYGEAQELLQAFGLPYLVAPMEAEAQCAFLDMIGLTQGTITDDSDIFLFGGQKVYKNFFNQSKHVELFKLDNIESNFGLNRNKMITLAFLTGSDYTIGIESVGTVLGMEILAEFPGSGIDCLKNFKKWWKSAHNNLSTVYSSKTKQRLINLHLPEAFPNENIFKAYLEPDIDKSTEKFSWAIPKVECLQKFTAEKFGWNQSKTCEILMPVMQKLGVKETQLRIDSYFSNIKLVKDNPSSSKRLTEAIKQNREAGSTPACSGNKLLDIKKTKLIKKKIKQKSKGAKVGELADDDCSTQPLPISKAKRQCISGSQIPLVGTSSNCIATPPKSEFNDENRVSILPLTKYDKKIKIYEKLLEKEKIIQVEMDKKIMEEKKKLAAQIFKKTQNKKK